MQWFEPVGYLAAILMFSTFYMKRMIPLRAVGIASNVTFIVFASSPPTSGRSWHCTARLLPLKYHTRMVQMIRLVKEGKGGEQGRLFNGLSRSFYEEARAFRRAIRSLRRVMSPTRCSIFRRVL